MSSLRPSIDHVCKRTSQPTLYLFSLPCMCSMVFITEG